MDSNPIIERISDLLGCLAGDVIAAYNRAVGQSKKEHFTPAERGILANKALHELFNYPESEDGHACLVTLSSYKEAVFYRAKLDVIDSSGKRSEQYRIFMRRISSRSQAGAHRIAKDPKRGGSGVLPRHC